MKIEVARNAGFCFGVKRAVQLAFETARTSGGPVHTLGPIIHNPQVVAELERHGVRAIADARHIRRGTVIIRSHGVHPDVIESLRRRGLTVVDATCPFVTKAQRAAAALRGEGRQVVIVGEPRHPEVVALKGYAGRDSVIFNHQPVRIKNRIGVLSQTTVSEDDFVRALLAFGKQASDIHIFNTICNATQIRQRQTMELAQRSDLMVVVGGRDSANTARLAELCKRVGQPTRSVETEDELRTAWFRGVRKVGVTAGASTPAATVQRVVRRIRELTTGKTKAEGRRRRGQ
ncbi:MAG: 4-hydroxy-3-methylbut-2-enyl diphosphate reductase [Candidatus Edwardsbacteria bacterium]|nr:4-hydroxy-3-methylbut-2-enyl diphosphate reductase [Candidatus Edwardsbacteria bacterium]